MIPCPRRRLPGETARRRNGGSRPDETVGPRQIIRVTCFIIVNGPTTTQFRKKRLCIFIIVWTVVKTWRAHMAVTCGEQWKIQNKRGWSVVCMTPACCGPHTIVDRIVGGGGGSSKTPDSRAAGRLLNSGKGCLFFSPSCGETTRVPHYNPLARY